jgi:hypothetical protein
VKGLYQKLSLRNKPDEFMICVHLWLPPRLETRFYA